MKTLQVVSLSLAGLVLLALAASWIYPRLWIRNRDARVFVDGEPCPDCALFYEATYPRAEVVTLPGSREAYTVNRDRVQVFNVGTPFTRVGNWVIGRIPGLPGVGLGSSKTDVKPHLQQDASGFTFFDLEHQSIQVQRPEK